MVSCLSPRNIEPKELAFTDLCCLKKNVKIPPAGSQSVHPRNVKDQHPSKHCHSSNRAGCHDHVVASQTILVEYKFGINSNMDNPQSITDLKRNVRCSTVPTLEINMKHNETRACSGMYVSRLHQILNLLCHRTVYPKSWNSRMCSFRSQSN